MSKDGKTSTSPWRWLWPAAVAVCVVVFYINGVRGQFIFDDVPHIVEKSSLRNWTLSRGLDRSRWCIFASLVLNYRIGELNPANYHLLNIGVHAIAALALYGIARRTLALRNFAEKDSQVLAFAIAAIWAVHPLQTESVTYIIQRCESMMGMFFLLALYALVRGATSSSAAPKLGWYAASVASFVLSTGCKEVAIVFPVVALLYDGMFLEESWSQVVKKRWGLYLAYLPGVIWLLLQLSPFLTGPSSAEEGPSLARAPSVGLSMSITPWMYLRSQPTALLTYLRLSFWPDDLCLDYRMSVVDDPLAIYGYGLIVLLLFATSAWLYWRGSALGWLGLTWFAILAPTSSFVPTADLVVEHRMYLPLASVVVIFVLGIYLAFKRVEEHRALGVAATAMLIVAALGLRTVVRNRDYFDPFHMWQLVAKQRPDNDRAHLNVGYLLMEKNDLEGAGRELELAVKLMPYDYKNLYGYGTFLARTGRKQEAIRHYQAAIESWPGYVLPYMAQGNIAAGEGRYADAIPHYRKALEVSPGHVRASGLLADVLAKSGQFEEAIALCKEILATAPGDLRAQYILGWSLAVADDASLRNGGQAFELAQRVVAATDAGNPDLLEMQALASAEAGQFSLAVASAEKALDLVKESKEERRSERLRWLAEKFRERQKVHFQDLKDKL
jgi:tetratricopeptide (TPR) repeat protein